MTRIVWENCLMIKRTSMITEQTGHNSHDPLDIRTTTVTVKNRNWKRRDDAQLRMMLIAPMDPISTEKQVNQELFHLHEEREKKSEWGGTRNGGKSLFIHLETQSGTAQPIRYHPSMSPLLGNREYCRSCRSRLHRSFPGRAEIASSVPP